jgi:hypothetical protein
LPAVSQCSTSRARDEAKVIGFPHLVARRAAVSLLTVRARRGISDSKGEP